VNRSRQTDPHLTNRQRRRKVRSKHRYHFTDNFALISWLSRKK